MAVKQQKKKSWLSRLNSWLHLWLGLSSGIIVVIVALTGTLFVFCDDIIDAMAGKALHVPVSQERPLSADALLRAFKTAHPDRKAFSYQAYRDPERSARIGSADAAGHFGFTWVDPYTGQSLHTSEAYYFFYVVAHVHSGEMPFGKTGNLIVQIATWIFLIELITGLVLWWPVKWTKSTRQQSFAIKWKASFKRVNYDLHNVPGFYSLLPALLLTVTGLLIVNDMLNKTTHQLLGSKEEPYKAMRKGLPAYDSTRSFLTLETLVTKTFAANPEATEVRLSVPKDSATAIMTMAGRYLGLKATDGRAFMLNRYTGGEIAYPREVTKGLVVEGMKMNLHIGFWAGWLGKIITAITGLICAALPITGFLIWWGRRNKSTHKKRTAVGVTNTKQKISAP